MSDAGSIDVPGQLGPYRLVRRLGYGGTSQVILAEVYGASGFSKQVAIKTLLPQFVGDPDYERLFIREARLGANLFHQNIVQIHDFGVQDGIQYMRLDYVDGVHLAEFRGEEPLSIARALFVCREVSSALAYLHRARDLQERPLGLVHRDLTPRNILISQSGEVRLADFGILKATAMVEITRGNVRRGTYYYMSPEQVRGDELTPASDQFALGCILAELVTGRRPFEAETIPEVLERIENGEPRGLERLPPTVAPVVERLLAHDPADRFSSTDVVHDRLATLLYDEADATIVTGLMR